VSEWIDRRRAAILLHLTSLPGPFHKGVLGAEAIRFMDEMSDAGFTVWQFLPLGPTHGHGSPYESLSSFAGNPELLDLRECVELGWLDAEQLTDCRTAERHAELRAFAAARFWQQVEQEPALAETVTAFEKVHADWLPDFALFSAIKATHNDQPWWSWPQALRDRHTDYLQQARHDHAEPIRHYIFEQLLFDRQWRRLKSHAESRDIQLFGDLPIYVAHDSADVWANRDYFTVNERGLCDEVAGVPPDYFSETGQRWGNPLYKWERLEADDFGWWVRRVARQLERMHLLRIDHFRGLEAYWAIPGASLDGIIGEWRTAPGAALLATLRDKLGQLPLIAEDLGIITPEVDALREDFGLPGMKILQFAFGGDDNNPYLPSHHTVDSVVYTGTHDNDTTLGWFTSAPAHVQQHALDVLQATATDMPWAMIEAALASPARLAVIPMQDLLELGSEARFNTPATLEGNWCWRMRATPDQLQQAWWKAGELNRKHDRS